MERACCPRAWWTSRATSRRARWWRWWGTAGSSRAGSSTSTPASCAGSAAPRRVTSRRGSATRASTKSSTATTSCFSSDGGPRNGPPYPPALVAPRGTRVAPRCRTGVGGMDVRQLVESKARAACAAAHALAMCGTRVKDEALAQMARALEEKSAALLEANRADLERARTKGLTRAFLDRLTLSEARIEEMANGLRQIAALPDPVGTVIESWRRPNGIEISRVRVPLGVIGFIYESRPNVTADAAGLCVKSGNAVLLRGGSEAIEANTLLAAVLAKALEKTGAPPGAIQFVDVTDRAAVAAMLEQDRYLDLVIPRGGEEFVRWVAERTRVHVLKHDKGDVYVFVDADADPDMATAIVLNAKTHRPSVCNALETLLVDRAIAERFLPAAAARLAEAGVELRGCPRTRALVASARPATDTDWAEGA